MEHVFDQKELETLDLKLPAQEWLGFDHDSKDYKLVDFDSYPLERGWNQEDLAKIQARSLQHQTSRHPDEILPMLQSWFTIGFLEAACQEKFSSTKLIGPDKSFNTHSLREWFQRKLQECHKVPVDKLRSFLQRLHETQKVAYRWIIDFELGSKTTQGDSRIIESAAPYIRTHILLAEMLRHLEVLVARHCPSLEQVWRERESPGWRYSRASRIYLNEKLKKKGWCPSTFESLFRYSHSAIEFASLIPSNNSLSADHDNCTETTCSAYTIDTATYKIQHANKDCACDFLAAPFDSLRCILEEGGIPVLDLDSLLRNSHENSVIRMEDHQVTVFSHVWSDGIGSSAEQGLPRCQISRLLNMANAVNPGGKGVLRNLIWIDSMCIPQNERLRSAAIRTMASVYRNSVRTIVLDSSLLNFNPNGRSTQELAVRVLSSTWMRRLWTLQKGALATNLHFMLSQDNFFAASFIVELARKLPDCFITWQLAQVLARMGGERGFVPMDLAGILRLIPFRSCSRLDDETLALAPAMGLENDIISLLERSGVDRMKQFWKLQKRVPLATPFITGKKLSAPGFRWALQSFVNNAQSAQIWGEPTAQVTDNGLVGTYLVLNFEQPLHLGKKHLDSSSKPVYHIHIRSADHKADKFRDDSLAETSLENILDIDMTFMVTSLEGNDFGSHCVGILLLDRFYPETTGILLREDHKRSDEDDCIMFQYSGEVFMVPKASEKLASLSGIVSRRRIRLS